MESKKLKLDRLAVRLRENLDEMKKPLVIEFTGTPKAGKTVCVDALSKFLRRHNIPVHVVTERASVCPIRNKKHIFFNTWTGCISLANMLEALQGGYSVIILDRGLFDTLVWMNYLNTEKHVSDTELAAIETYYLLEPWQNLIDIVVALTVDPNTSLQREFKDQISDIMGTIMNPSTLSLYNASFHKCLEKYKDYFPNMLKLDTTDKKPVDGVAEIAFAVLQAADRLVDEEIAVVDREFVAKQFAKSRVMQDVTVIEPLMDSLISHIKWVRRNEAEESTKYVQLVAVGVIVRDGEVLVINHRGIKQGRMVNRNTVWAGGHIRRSDHPRNAHRRNTFRRGLIRELREELNINLDLEDLPLQPQALIWDNTSPKSAIHLGIFYEYELAPNVSRASLHERELWEAATKSMFSRFMPLDNALTELSDWESWSMLYLRDVKHIVFPMSDHDQLVLF